MPETKNDTIVLLSILKMKRTRTLFTTTCTKEKKKEPRFIKLQKKCWSCTKKNLRGEL